MTRSTHHHYRHHIAIASRLYHHLASHRTDDSSLTVRARTDSNYPSLRVNSLPPSGLCETQSNSVPANGGRFCILIVILYPYLCKCISLIQQNRLRKSFSASRRLASITRLIAMLSWYYTTCYSYEVRGMGYDLRGRLPLLNRLSPDLDEIGSEFELKTCRLSCSRCADSIPPESRPASLHF